MPRRKPFAVDAETVLYHLELLRRVCMKAESYQVALRALELQGRQIGMWREPAEAREKTLEEMILEAGGHGAESAAKTEPRPADMLALPEAPPRAKE